MDKASDAAALAGLAQNPNIPADQRLACANQALDFYVERFDLLEQLIEDAESHGADMQPLRSILYPDETPPGTEEVAPGVYVVKQREGVVDGTQPPLEPQ